jgi:DNA (cytosine-5)-methyltransferase 1
MSAVPIDSTTPDVESNLWRTPPALFARLDAAHGPFVLDAAADAANHLCPHWLGPGGLAEDALRAAWVVGHGVGGPPLRAWCNPPYSRGMVGAFVRKATHEAAIGHARTTLLIPAWTDQPWWHLHLWDGQRGAFRPGVHVEFLLGRVRFLRPDGGKASSPTFPSIVVTIGGW